MRPSRDEIYMQDALNHSRRGTCSRRQCGCVLINNRGHVLSIGYNGNPSGLPHCIDTPCLASKAPSGTALDECLAVHAEMNALLQCPNIYDIDTAYCTSAPCTLCIRLLINTSCTRIVYLNDYPHPISQKLWEQCGRRWEKYAP